MKRSNKLLLMLVLVTVLLAGILLVIRYLPKDEEPSETAPGADRYKLYAEEIGNVTRVAFKHRDHEACEFVKQDGKWIRPDAPDFPVAGDYLEQLLASILTVTSDKKMEVDGAYGFDDPQFTIEIDGKEKNVLTFGTTNALGDKTYFRLNGGDVYLVDRTIWAGFNVDQLEFVGQEEIPQFDEYHYLQIEFPGFSKEFSYNRNLWVIRDTLDQTYHDKVSAVVNNYSALYWGGTVAFRPDEETIREMGLDADHVIRLTFMTPLGGGYGIDDGKMLKYTLEIGNEIPGTTYVYARYPGSPVIGKIFYTVRKNVLLLNEE